MPSSPEANCHTSLILKTCMSMIQARYYWVHSCASTQAKGTQALDSLPNSRAIGPLIMQEVNHRCDGTHTSAWRHFGATRLRGTMYPNARISEYPRVSSTNPSPVTYLSLEMWLRS